MESDSASTHLPPPPAAREGEDAVDGFESDEGSSSPPLNPMADALLQRCIALADELVLLEKKLLLRLPPKLRSKKGNLPIELRHFRSAIQVEQRLLEALSYKLPTERSMHTCRSSNLKFLESVWAVAKTCAGLQVIFRTVYLTTDEKAAWLDLQAARGKEKAEEREKRLALKKSRRKTPVQVDIIAQSGLEWIKVASISPKRLETEFAKARWEAEAFLNDDDGDGGDNDSDTERTVDEFQRDSDAFALVRSARTMVQAAQQTRVQYLHPEITIVLPNISYDPHDPATSDPRSLVTAILATGARVQTANGLLLHSPTPPPDHATYTPSCISTDSTLASRLHGLSVNPPPPPSTTTYIHDVLHRLSASADPTSLITPNVILDCTILLALVSDLSHDLVVEQPVFHRHILQQVRAEREEPILPHWVYPALAGRRLACTFDAYKRFREIVEIVGSEREKARAAILVALPGRDWKHPSSSSSSSSSTSPPCLPSQSPSSARRPQTSAEAIAAVEAPPADDADTPTRLATLQGLSRHPVPATLRLPIAVIDSLEAELTAGNPVAARIGPELSSVNRSSLFTAWQLGWTIVTTNGTVVKRLHWLVEENRMCDADAGPKVHFLAVACSLVGKMKKGTDILAGE
ncbi:hypothetical protein DRE_02302 [Drechslerella stenobrocha 248]|uniref:DUF1308 domain-containing protein n=1 Tax=Drechslerella stenobrocha 248 TaxID=1043628 RepID=W7I791_9PEZI|nr:hypothetical protein DRE_02302 [Drechslerella stenobrocha 248]